MTDVLIIGGGGREHALAWKLAQSPGCGRLHSAPGNPGMEALGECHPIPVTELDALTELARRLDPGLVVVGPEAPLAAGLADRLQAAGIPVFGPTAAAARIESSKAYARDLMTRAGVPQPHHAAFRAAEAARAYLDSLESAGAAGIVVKASGLAAGKGAIVCDSFAQARTAVEDMLGRGSFGAAGEEVVIEERLRGEEVSLLVLTDGERALPLPPAQDYKRAFDGDRSLWSGDYEILTGGMGCYAPAPVLPEDEVSGVVDGIIRPVLAALAEDGAPFRGCLYAGLMKCPGGFKVIEFNCRFGDPETQVVLPLLDADLLELMTAAAAGELPHANLRVLPGAAVTVVMASGGYPGNYSTGFPVTGVAEAESLPGVTVFHAGTALHEDGLVTAGGRVLAVTGVGGDFRQARERAYAGAERIDFPRRHFRTDIAARVLSDNV